MAYRNPLLLITRKQIKNQQSLNVVISSALPQVEPGSNLYIQITADYTQLSILIDELVSVYDTARHYSEENKNISTYVLFGSNYLNLFNYCDWTIALYQSSDALSRFINKPGIPIKLLQESNTDLSEFKPDAHPMDNLTGSKDEYHTVAVGGTFDHLHDGHKILLTASIFLASTILIIGVTGPKLLVNKKYAEYMESYDQRASIVGRFVKLIDFNQRTDFYQINDVCGPTGHINEIDALVVSFETASGGDYVNNLRKEEGLKQLKIIAVCVIGGKDSEQFKEKLSSTYLRKLEAEKQQ
ncbi:hypothetical protein FOA43_003365 [Brettanomyces nanus]|uniref:Cytidyltransferase-like domain-containing protein n=1 Tax=Eeniella nana TaxID=13502 RepID=A0A875S8H1_EENNA|nr:uncharacterized protein FOA43_003365 [Brettanomyces nanus]QPG75979.1 hypothetical protein FOA43_003365 [Brettanomyces nanus]